MYILYVHSTKNGQENERGWGICADNEQIGQISEQKQILYM